MNVLVKEPEIMMQAVEHSIQGFSEQTVRALSASRNEPAWMLEFRVAAWRQFEAMPGRVSFSTSIKLGER